MKHVTLYGPQGRKVIFTLLAAAVLAACGGGGGNRPATTATATTTAAPPVTSSGGILPNTPSETLPLADVTPAVPPAEMELQISGAPKTTAKVDESYSFVPVADGPEGDILYFSVANLPSWLTFKPATGELSGTPTAAQTGVYSEVTIQVAAGAASEILAPFDIEVVSTGMQNVTLSWAAPTQNEDGSVLSDLAGYRIRYGETSGSYTTVISLTNPGLVAYYVDGLVPGTYYFVISAYNSKGVESNYSNEAFKAV